MEFADFILLHDGDDLGALALSRDRLAGEVEDFDLALSTLEARRKLRSKVPEWVALPQLRYPFRLSAEQCSSSETARYKASVAASACGLTAAPTKMAENAGSAVRSDAGADKKGPKCGRRGKLADLTGGMGVDSWAFAQVFDEVLYNEMRPELADAARHNFAALGLNNITVRNCTLGSPVKTGMTTVAEMTTEPESMAPVMAGSDRPSSTVQEVLGDFRPDIIFLDPARRASDGRKVFRLEDCQPDVLQLLPELFAACPRLLLKLSPMADITLVCKQLQHVKAVHVVAAEGECKELLLLLERGYEGPYDLIVYDGGAVLVVDQVQGLFGRGPISGAGPGPMSMALRPVEGTSAGLGPGDKSGLSPNSGWTRSTGKGQCLLKPGQCLFEPGKALLKAGAFDLPCTYGLEKLGQHTHLYVGEQVPEELRPFGKVFEILEVTLLNNRSIKEIGKRYPSADVTARNIPITSDELRKRLGVRSGASIHIFGLQAGKEKLLLVTRRSANT